MGEATRTSTPAAPGVQGKPPASTRMQRYVAWRTRRIGERGTRRVLWRVAVALVGAMLVVGGIALVPLPGPGWVIVFVGLGVLATEFTWAERLLHRVRSLVDAWTEWLRGRSMLVRSAVAAGCVICVCIALVALSWLLGTPSWMPDGVPLVR